MERDDEPKNLVTFKLFDSFRIISPSWNPMVASDPTGPYARRFITYSDPVTQFSRVGLLDQSGGRIQPVSFTDRKPISSLYQIIDLGTHPVAIENDGIPMTSDSVQLLPPLQASDVFTIMKDERELQFNLSGFDPNKYSTVNWPGKLNVITRPSNLIVAHGGKLFAQAGGYYEGEFGVIVSSKAYMVTEREAWKHVWGFTILNGVNVMEKRRQKTNVDMHQKSTYSMGPIAIPKERFSQFQRMEVHVNGSKVDEFTTESLINEIPKLIKIVSASRTLHSGEVLATQISVVNSSRPDLSKELKHGDIVSVTIPGIGTLSNIMEITTSSNDEAEGVPNQTILKHSEITNINGKLLSYQVRGSRIGAPIIFIHGLGGSLECFGPLIANLDLENTRPMVLVDLEGHGMSSTQSLNEVNAVSLAKDVLGVIKHSNIVEQSGITIVAHSLGCLPAVLIACQYSNLVAKVVLLGPPPLRLSDARKTASKAHAEEVRTGGMSVALDMMLATAGVSELSAKRNPLSLTAVRLSVLAQSPEGYAKAVVAFGTLPHDIDFKKMRARLLVVTGEEDWVCPPRTALDLSAEFGNSVEPVILPGVGHWHVFEDPASLANALKPFILS